MKNKIIIEAVNGRPIINFDSCLVSDPQGFATKLMKEFAGVSELTARKLGKAFALLVASRLSPQNEINRSNLSKCADQYYINLATPEANQSFNDGFDEAVDEMLQAVVARENHIEVLARRLGFGECASDDGLAGEGF